MFSLKASRAVLTGGGFGEATCGGTGIAQVIVTLCGLLSLFLWTVCVLVARCFDMLLCV